MITLDLDVEVELLVGGRAVLEEREPFAVVLTNTHIERSPVANGLAAVTPFAALLGRNTLGVDVVLSRGGLALPVEVLLAIRASQGLSLTVAKAERDSLRLGTGVVGTADGNLVPNLVLDVDTTNTLHAKLLGKVGVGQVKLAVAALQTTNGLASLALAAGPLGLLVTSRASVGAHGARVAGVTSNGGNDVAKKLVDQRDVLDTRPATKAKVVERNGTVLRGERATVNLAIGKVRVDTRRAAGAAAAGCSGLGRRRASRSGRGAGSFRRRGRSLEELGRGGRRSRSAGGSGSRGGRRSGAAGAALASLGRSNAVGPLESTVGDTLADIIGADALTVEFIFDDGASSTSLGVTVAVVVLGGDKASRGQGEDDGVQLHGDCFALAVVQW